LHAGGGRVYEKKRRGSMMIPKVWLINIVLALCAVFIGKSAYSVWIQEDRSNSAAPSKRKAAPAAERRQTSEPPPLMEASYEVIADRNLFSSDRAEYLPPEPVGETVSLPQLPGKKINLYGVIIMENTRKALIDNPDRKPHEPFNKWVSVGETVGNLTVAAIDNESILFREGARKYRIPLYTKKPGQFNSPGPVMNRSASAPTVVNTETKKASPKPKSLGGRAAKERGTSGSGGKKQTGGSGKSQIISTPFGTFERKSN
jgi:hypothetical protein